jgi:hypothetical protein
VSLSRAGHPPPRRARRGSSAARHSYSSIGGRVELGTGRGWIEQVGGPISPRPAMHPWRWRCVWWPRRGGAGSPSRRRSPGRVLAPAPCARPSLRPRSAMAAAASRAARRSSLSSSMPCGRPLSSPRPASASTVAPVWAGGALLLELPASSSSCGVEGARRGEPRGRTRGQTGSAVGAAYRRTEGGGSLLLSASAPSKGARQWWGGGSGTWWGLAEPLNSAGYGGMES